MQVVNSNCMSISTRAITHFKKNGKVDIVAELKANIESEHARVIDYSIHNNVMYAAVVYNIFDDALGIYYATTVVEIIAYEINEQAAIIRMVKYLETQNPPYTDCSLKILKLLPVLDSVRLTPAKYQNALAWRRACLEKH